MRTQIPHRKQPPIALATHQHRNPQQHSNRRIAHASTPPHATPDTNPQTPSPPEAQPQQAAPAPVPHALDASFPSRKVYPLLHSTPTLSPNACRNATTSALNAPHHPPPLDRLLRQLHPLHAPTPRRRRQRPRRSSPRDAPPPRLRHPLRQRHPLPREGPTPLLVDGRDHAPLPTLRRNHPASPNRSRAHPTLTLRPRASSPQPKPSPAASSTPPEPASTPRSSYSPASASSSSPASTSPTQPSASSPPSPSTSSGAPKSSSRAPPTHTPVTHRRPKAARKTRTTPHLRLYCIGFAAACALNVLTKGLIGVVFPAAIVVLYLLLTRGLKRTLHRLRELHPWTTLTAFLLIAAPWHILAGLANPTQGHPTPFRFAFHYTFPLR